MGIALEANVIDKSLDLQVNPTSGSIVVMWSGWLTMDEGGGVDPRTWGPTGWGRFEGACERLAADAAATGRELWFRTHASHVLSDVPSCLRFLQRRPVGLWLLLDPARMVTESMLSAAEDHVRRIMEALGGAEGVRAVALGSAGTGVAPEVMRELVERLVPGDRWVVE